MTTIIDLEKFLSAELKTVSLDDMAKEFGLTVEQVINYRKALDIPTRIEKGGVVDLLTYKKLRDAGKDNEQIANFFGVDIKVIEKLQTQLDILKFGKTKVTEFGVDTSVKPPKSITTPVQEPAVQKPDVSKAKNVQQPIAQKTKDGRKQRSDRVHVYSITKEAIEEQIAKGLGTTELANHFDICVSTLYKLAYNFGIELKRKRPMHTVFRQAGEFTRGEIEDIRKMKKDGHSDVEIACKYNSTQENIQKLRTIHNIPTAYNNIREQALEVLEETGLERCCPRCKSQNVRQQGYRWTNNGQVRKYRCDDCHKTFTADNYNKTPTIESTLTKEAITRELATSKTIREIASDLGTTYHTLRKRMDELGIVTKRVYKTKYTRPQDFTEDEIADIAALKNLGYSDGDIAEKHNSTVGIIQRIRTMHGIDGLYQIRAKHIKSYEENKESEKKQE